MEITLTRKEFTPKSTISELQINTFKCYALEDFDRGLTSTMTPEEIAAKKIHSITAIPYGRYRVVVSWSNRFKKYLPEVLNVPGYAGIRIHAGNLPEHTEGCILPGLSKDKDFVGKSAAAFNVVFNLINIADKKEKIYITIKK